MNVKKKNTHNKTPPKLELSADYIESIRSTSYLGKKGSTILKSAVSKEDEEFLRKELFVKPVVMGSAFAAAAEVAAAAVPSVSPARIGGGAARWKANARARGAAWVGVSLGV